MEPTLNISGHTKMICLIGSPVEHSMSPAMHNAAFAKLGVDYCYLAFDVQPEQLETAIKGLRELGFAGANVTMPCKTHVLQYLDELTPAAELMGAVNTIEVKGDKLIGHNTDGAGFMRNLDNHGVDYKGKKITINGAGGAGSAIFTQAALDGVSAIDVFNIKDEFFDSTAERVKTLSEKTGVPVTLYDLADREQLAKSVSESAVFINATRVGMPPLEDECTLDEDMHHDGLAVADTVYEPRETKLIKMAKAHGLITCPGVGMLLCQAALGEEILTGQAMPIDYIEEKFYK